MSKILFKNGIVIDGTGADKFVGDVLVSGKKIVKVSKTPIDCKDAEVVDCKGLAVAPGFIDCHSHQDYFFYDERKEDFFGPFLRQGITTFVCGNCGFGAAGFMHGTKFGKDVVAAGLGGAMAGLVPNWESWAEYYRIIEEKGMVANMANLAAHGATLGSILGAGNLGKNAVTPEVEKQVLDVLEEGMNDGALGVSLGLAYRPGNYTTKEQIRHIAELVAKHHKILTVHREVEAALSAYYNDFSEPHNVRWLREFFDNVFDTGCKVHISHLIYPGRQTFPSYQPMQDLINEYRAKGLDVTFDMYAFEYGATECGILISADTQKDAFAMLTDKELHDKREQEFILSGQYSGIFPPDVFLSKPISPDWEKYKGMFLDQIAKARGTSDFDTVMDLYRDTNGRAMCMLSPYYKTEFIVDQMKHPLVTYQTDAWIEIGCTPNPSAYGSMTRFLRMGREEAGMRIEDVVKKMTSQSADRFELRLRGKLKDGYFADITIFDPENVREGATRENPGLPNIGIKSVYVNGELVVKDDKYVASGKAGMVITV